jgi:hypothetical protein
MSKSHLPIVAARAVGAVLLAATLGAGAALAAPLTLSELNLGTAANYALVDLADGTTLGWNSGPIAGNVLVGNGVTVSTSGGNNGGLTNGGVLSFDSTTICTGGNGTCGNGLNTPPPTMSVSGPTPDTSVTGAALASANMVAANVAAAVTSGNANQTISSIANGTIAWNGNSTTGIDLIAVTGTSTNPTFTLSGTADEYFVFDIEGGNGAFSENNPMSLSGILPSHVLFVFTGTSGNVFSTSGGNTLFGTYLAVDGGAFQFSELDLTGALIMGDSNGAGADGGGNIQFVSGSQIPTFEPFTVPAPLIGHGLPVLLAVGGMLFGGTLMEKFKKRQ